MKPLLVIIGGPTGIGKTVTAINIAKHFNTEIISSDSRQIYKELKIGTAVPSPKELKTVKHHLIQNHSIEENYNASSFESEVLNLLNLLFKRHKIVIMTGGSGLYIDAVCSGIDDLPSIPVNVRKKFEMIFQSEGNEKIAQMVQLIDPEYYDKVDIKNHKRLLKALEVHEVTGKTYSSLLKNLPKERFFDILRINLDIDRTELYNRINVRVDNMIQAGLIDEALKVYPKKHLTALKTVGYKELFDFFDGKISKEEAISQIKNHTRAYARKQLTWFRKYSDAKWFKPDDSEKIIKLIDNYPLND